VYIKGLVELLQWW